MAENTDVLNKSTHSQIELWQPIIKSKDGNYIAVLSDTSIDRDDEIVGKSALLKIMQRDGEEDYLAGLIDHENKVLNQVCEWTNKRIEEIDGHTALIAEPKFYLSNNNAKQIKGMLDEGARIGISIGAIVKDSKTEKINDKAFKVYTDLDLIEASFVAIPSNKHGQCMAVAKSFNTKQEENNMSDEKTYTQKEFDDAISKEKNDLDSQIEKFKAEIVEKDSKIKQLEKEAEEQKEEEEKESEKKEESEKAMKEKDAEIAKLKSDLEIEKKKPLYKGDHQYSENNTEEDKEKAYKSGKLPIMKSN